MQLIADILSFNTNQELLSKDFKNVAIDWDAVVIIASQHLMLPALYCKLKEKELLPLIPDDLNLYLEEIAEINRGRNKILLKEAHEISKIFKKENIEHVFIKGVALVAGQFFKDPAERMIGDVDILVTPKQVHKAFDILTQHGYDKTVGFNYEQKNYRHLARQISKHKFGAIELHSEILIHKYKNLLRNEQVLKNRQIINGIAIPSNEDSIKIAVLGLQINDKAHTLGYVSFKTLYDCMALKITTSHVLLRDFGYEKHAQSFLLLASTFYKELIPHKTSFYSIFLQYYFIFRSHYPKMGNFIYSLIKTSMNIIDRMIIFIFNKSYRRHILKNKLLSKKI